MNDMHLLRMYLLVGLIAHKVVWEVLKRRQRYAGASEHLPSLSIRGMLIKAVKIGILLGVVAQTAAWDVFPIAQAPLILRVMGVVMYTVGLFITIEGRLRLGDNWSDIETAQVLHEQTIVSHGVYRYIRHPIYIGDLLLLFGLELSLNSWLVIAVGLLAPVVLWQAVREENMLVHLLPGYDVYCTRTKRFIPFVV
jgi:protein-S-isoprenylcysteine O-methyltransferase Ste14